MVCKLEIPGNWEKCEYFLCAAFSATFPFYTHTTDCVSINHRSISMIRSQRDFDLYQNFAYHISLLRNFVSIHSKNKGDGDDDDRKITSVHGNNVWSSLKKKRGLGDSGKGSSGHGASGHGGSRHGGNQHQDLSTRTTGGLGGIRRVSTATGTLSAMA